MEMRRMRFPSPVASSFVSVAAALRNAFVMILVLDDKSIGYM